MAKKVLVGGSKGGSGKSLTCLNLISVALLEGKTVGVVDADKQKTLSKDLAYRAEAYKDDFTRKQPLVRNWRFQDIAKGGSSLDAVFEDLESAGADIIFVDVGGFTGNSLLHGAAKSDLWILPSGIYPGDIEGGKDALSLAKTLAKKKLSFTLRMLMNKIPSKPGKEHLDDYWTVFGKITHFKTQIRDWRTIPNSQRRGLGAAEAFSSSPASAAYRALYSEIEEILNG
jgi:MinD-like ATPase involved in chromosome partitioning or flagellar assembly